MRDKLIEIPVTCQEPYLELLLKVETGFDTSTKETTVHRVFLDSGIDSTQSVDITAAILNSEHLHGEVLTYAQIWVAAEQPEGLEEAAEDVTEITETPGKGLWS